MAAKTQSAVVGSQGGKAVSKLYVLLCGYEFLPKTVSTRGRGQRIILAAPICAYLIETEQGFVLFDTGVNARILRDPGLRERYYAAHGWMVPVVRPEHELLTQLADIGICANDVQQVVLSHMHLDHTGNLGLFPHAQVIVQRQEHDYAFSVGHSPFWFDCDYDDPSIRWRIVEGDVDLAPGLRILSTPGHTLGHQSLLVELKETGTCILVGDAGDLLENFSEEVLPGVAADDQAALESIRRINNIVKERRGMIFFTHDPDFVQKIRLAPAYYC
jgi:N-acyl homoserine lactone hydrolase